MGASKLTDQVSGAINMQQPLYVHSFLPPKVAIQGTLHVVSIQCCSFIKLSLRASLCTDPPSPQ